MIQKNNDGNYVVPSSTGTGHWLVSSDMKTCNCPSFIYKNKGKAPCKHIEAVLVQEMNKTITIEDGFVEWKPEIYSKPLSISDFVATFGDTQLDHLMSIAEVVIIKGRVYKL